jgi:N-acyl-phosphatidylethanolamine-hydrolysing phospholipase D
MKYTYRNVPMSIKELPDIQAVVISHTHYDHLDYGSVQQLIQKQQEKPTHWYVPSGMKQWMVNTGALPKHVHDLSWWKESVLSTPNGDVTFTFTPAQHWCMQMLCDKNTVLWGSWAVTTSNAKFWFGGDTGYCKVFKQIGNHFGGFDFAAIPIGSYLPRDVMKNQHVDPEEAVQIHQDIKLRRSLGIHWGTFTMGCLEHYLEPRKELKRKCEAKGIPAEEFFVLKHGERKVITCRED